MKFYSEKVNKLFNTEVEAIAAEKDFEEQETRKKKEMEALKIKAAQQKERERESFEAIKKAYENLNKMIDKHNKEFGAPVFGKILWNWDFINLW